MPIEVVGKSVALRQDQWEALAKYATAGRDKVSRSAVVRKAVDEFFDRERDKGLEGRFEKKSR